MGRTDGKLIPFLDHATKNKLYENLVVNKDGVMCADLKRFHSKLDFKYQKIIIDYFRLNKKEFVSYPNGKAVFKAALKKSIYLVMLNKDGTKLHFRFATKEEQLAKKIAQKAKREKCQEYLPGSPSSSGYESALDDNFSDGDCQSPFSAGNSNVTQEGGPPGEVLIHDFSILKLNDTADELVKANDPIQNLPPITFDDFLELEKDDGDDLMDFNFENKLLDDNELTSWDQSVPQGPALSAETESHSGHGMSLDLYSYVGNDSISVSALPIDSDEKHNSINKPMENKTEVLAFAMDTVGEEKHIMNLTAASIPSEVTVFARKQIWQCIAKQTSEQQVLYICESKWVDLKIEEAKDYPEVSIPMVWYEEGKNYVGYYLFKGYIVLVYA